MDLKARNNSRLTFFENRSFTKQNSFLKPGSGEDFFSEKFSPDIHAIRLDFARRICYNNGTTQTPF